MSNDDSVDCVKGIAIGLVVVFHSIFDHALKVGSILSIEQGVPLFLMSTAFLIYTKSRNTDSPVTTMPFRSFKKLFFPYLSFQILIVVISLSDGSFSVRRLLASGGLGMGSYYIWLYVQFLWLLPISHRIYRRTRANVVVPIVISAAIEILFSVVASTERFGNFPDYIWRLFVGRYVFITYIAYLIVDDEFVKRKYILLAFAGACFSLLVRYQTVETFPWFYSTEAFAWLGFHWPMYFYSGAVFCILYRAAKGVSAPLKRTLGWMGRNSWPIFLSQMLFFSAFDLNDVGVDSDLMALSIFLISSFTFSIISAQIYMLGTEGISRLRHSDFALGASR